MIAKVPSAIWISQLGDMMINFDDS